MKRSIIKISLSVFFSFLIISSFIYQSSALSNEIADINTNVSVTDTKGEIVGIRGLNRKGSDINTARELPRAYSSKDEGYTSPVKDQEGTNLCWAYTTCTVLETYVRKNNISNELFSPLHMAYKNTINSNFTGYTARPNWLLSGGRPENGIGYLTSHEGPREEYLEKDGVLNLNSFSISRHENEYKKNAEQFDESSCTLYYADSILYVDTSSPENVKQAILDYGSVYATFVVSIDCFSETEGEYLCTDINEADEGGHAITIIGWDDDYDSSNFTGIHMTDRNGAWLCQNSWGNESGYDGLFYISYDDCTLFNEEYGMTWTVTNLEKPGRFDCIYQLTDTGSFSDYTPWSSQNQIIYMNKFDFGSDELLEKINFESESVGASYTLYLIPVKSNGQPEGYGKWTKLKQGVIDYCGYMSIPVSKELENGEHFIGVSITKNGGSDNSIGIVNNIPGFYTIPDLISQSSYAAYITDSSKLNIYDITRKHALFSIKAQTRKSYRYGDTNIDRKIDIIDATLIQQKLAYIENSNRFDELCADCDRDGVITISDASFIQMHLANLSIPYEIGTLIT